MKKSIKFISLLTAVLLTATSFASCAKKESNSSKKSADIKKIGIIQYAPHESLDNCYTGIVEGLKEAGFIDGENIEIDYQNAQAEIPTADQMAKNMVSKNYDLIFGIATPAAMSAYSAARAENVPVIFSAVSDPVAEGVKLVNSLENPGVNCTGTSDVLNMEAQLKLIRAMQPNAKKIGVLYTLSEANSVSHLKRFRELAPKYGFEVIAEGIQSAADIPQAATSLSAKVDCINNFTDNLVVTNLSTLIAKAKDAKIPVYGSEVEQVAKGCIASESIDYVSLGKKTGKMAAEVLKGADIKTMAVMQISDSEPVINSVVLKEFNIALPDAYKNARDVK